MEFILFHGAFCKMNLNYQLEVQIIIFMFDSKKKKKLILLMKLTRDEDDDIKKYSGHITMMPFGIKHEEMLNSDSFVPQYETSPGDVECNEDSECCSNNNVKYVWCNKKTKKCAAKVQQGGAVKEGFPASACYCMEGNVPFIENLKCACKPPI